MEKNQQYLYEYENGEKVRNIGFLKIDNQMDKSTIQIYAKPLDSVKGILFQKPNGDWYVGTWERNVPGIATSIQQLQPQPPTQAEQSIIQPRSGETEQLVAPDDTLDNDIEIEEYIIPSNVTYEKIKRQDLSRLPRREWRIANNSFLLHGFYNYHHLLYIEEDGKVWIGVPGIYHEKEETAAKAFGFGKFRRLIDVDVELAEDEKNTIEDFGYWCRQIPNS